MKTSLWCVLLLAAGALTSLCAVSCASNDRESVQQAARQGELPERLSSYEAAVDYTEALFAGGHVDRVELGSRRYLVVIQHGSGRPVLGIAVYQKKFMGWQRVPTTHPAVFDFVRASVRDGKIILTEERSQRVSTLYDPRA